MIIAEVEITDAAKSGFSELGWQTLQRLRALGPKAGLGRARRRLRRVKRTESATSLRPFLRKASVSVQDSLQEFQDGHGKAPAARAGLQAFELEKTSTGTPQSFPTIVSCYFS